MSNISNFQQGLLFLYRQQNNKTLTDADKKLKDKYDSDKNGKLSDKELETLKNDVYKSIDGDDKLTSNDVVELDKTCADKDLDGDGIVSIYEKNFVIYSQMEIISKLNKKTTETQYPKVTPLNGKDYDGVKILNKDGSYTLRRIFYKDSNKKELKYTVENSYDAKNVLRSQLTTNPDSSSKLYEFNASGARTFYQQTNSKGVVIDKTIYTNPPNLSERKFVLRNDDNTLKSAKKIDENKNELVNIDYSNGVAFVLQDGKKIEIKNKNINSKCKEIDVDDLYEYANSKINGKLPTEKQVQAQLYKMLGIKEEEQVSYPIITNFGDEKTKGVKKLNKDGTYTIERTIYTDKTKKKVSHIIYEEYTTKGRTLYQKTNSKGVVVDKTIYTNPPDNKERKFVLRNDDNTLKSAKKISAKDKELVFVDYKKSEITIIQNGKKIELDNKALRAKGKELDLDAIYEYANTKINDKLPTETQINNKISRMLATIASDKNTIINADGSTTVEYKNKDKKVTHTKTTNSKGVVLKELYYKTPGKAADGYYFTTRNSSNKLTKSQLIKGDSTLVNADYETGKIKIVQNGKTLSFEHLKFKTPQKALDVNEIYKYANTKVNGKLPTEAQIKQKIADLLGVELKTTYPNTPLYNNFDKAVERISKRLNGQIKKCFLAAMEYIKETSLNAPTTKANGDSTLKLNKYACETFMKYITNYQHNINIYYVNTNKYNGCYDNERVYVRKSANFSDTSLTGLILHDLAHGMLKRSGFNFYDESVTTLFENCFVNFANGKTSKKKLSQHIKGIEKIYIPLYGRYLPRSSSVYKFCGA